MAHGPGIYDVHCTRVREALDADMVALIVIKHGAKPGFSAQGTPEGLSALADMMEFMAKEIRKDMPRDLSEALRRKREARKGGL